MCQVYVSVCVCYVCVSVCVSVCLCVCICLSVCTGMSVGLTQPLSTCPSSLQWVPGAQHLLTFLS